MKCRTIADHDFQPIRGGNRERCAKCKTEYPCAHACKHYDCMIERGEALPEHVTYVAPKSTAATAMPETEGEVAAAEAAP